jgi:hypothetical protein
MKARACDWILLLALSLLGCAQMLADLSGLGQLKALAQATQVSPAMKVFTAQSGYETYAASFYIGYWDAQGNYQEIELDRARYALLQGPYNRRNVYGAAFSYGPLLAGNEHTAAMHQSVLRHALCTPGAVRAELAIPAASHFLIRVAPLRAAPEGLDLQQELHCEAICPEGAANAAPLCATEAVRQSRPRRRSGLGDLIFRVLWPYGNAVTVTA